MADVAACINASNASFRLLNIVAADVLVAASFTSDAVYTDNFLNFVATGTTELEAALTSVSRASAHMNGNVRYHTGSHTVLEYGSNYIVHMHVDVLEDLGRIASMDVCDKLKLEGGNWRVYERLCSPLACTPTTATPFTG